MCIQIYLLSVGVVQLFSCLVVQLFSCFVSKTALHLPPITNKQTNQQTNTIPPFFFLFAFFFRSAFLLFCFFGCVRLLFFFIYFFLFYFFWKTNFCKVSTLKLQPFAFAPTNLLHTSPFSHQYYTYFLEKVTYPQLLTFASCFATHNY